MACGEPLSAGDRVEASAYLAALGVGDFPIIGVAAWSEAARITQRTDLSRAWWEAEERARTSLQSAAAASLGDIPLIDALSLVTGAAEALHGMAALAATRAGAADPALTRVAAGAAAQACHQRALALATDAGPGHLFAIKFRLFASGRWPLGIVGDACFVF